MVDISGGHRWALLPPITTFHAPPAGCRETMSFVAWDGTRFPAKLGPHRFSTDAPRDKLGKNSFSRGEVRFFGTLGGGYLTQVDSIASRCTISPAASTNQGNSKVFPSVYGMLVSRVLDPRVRLYYITLHYPLSSIFNRISSYRYNPIMG